MTTFLLALLLGLIPGDDAPDAPRPGVVDQATQAKLREIAFQAAREGDVKTLAAYFESGLPADIVNARGDTLLILAAYHGHDDAVKTILTRPKILIDAKNKMGFTALTGAAYKGYLGIAKRLVAKGANPNAANKRGQTPLMYAAMFGRTEVVAFLVRSHANLDAKDDQGRTALMLASEQGGAEVVSLLAKAREQEPSPPAAAPRPTPICHPTSHSVTRRSR